jgi:hypothetical protein
MTGVGRQVSGRATQDAGIYPCFFSIWAVDGEEKRIKDLVGRTPRIPVAVLKVAAQLSSCFQIVLAAANGDQVRVVVNVFPERLCIATVKAKPSVPSSKSMDGTPGRVAVIAEPFST